jgi:hypothetical protein
MTNILDAVEPDAIVRECAGCGGPLSRITKTTCFMDGKFNTDDPIYSRKTVESLLEAHRKQVLLEAAELDRLRAEVASLKEELAEYEKHDAARDEKIRSLTTYHGLGCACSYDNVDDVCEHHSPKLMALTQQLAAANAKIDALMREYCQTTEDANGEGQKPTPDQAYYMMPCAQLLAQAQDAGTERRNNSIRDVIKGEDEQQ